jgi:hypothetical protein
MTFYDFNATAQHGWATATFYPSEVETWRSAWREYEMHGFWNLEYLEVAPGQKFWDRACKSTTGWRCGLRPGWQEALTAALIKLQPDLASGALTGIFLGDEPMLAGISAANITAAADFIRAHVGVDAKIYWNDGCRPFYDGHTDPCASGAGGHNPASCWTNESKVPASVDWVSCDTYEDPTVSKSPWPWDPSTSIPEATAVQYFVEHFIATKLHLHQKVVLVPGLFGNRSDTWTDDFLTDKMQRYWEWAQADTLVAGFNGYHYNTRVAYPECKGDQPGPCPSLSGHACCYKYGAVAYPRLNALLQKIGHAIAERADHLVLQQQQHSDASVH